MMFVEAQKCEPKTPGLIDEDQISSRLICAHNITEISTLCFLVGFGLEKGHFNIFEILIKLGKVLQSYGPYNNTTSWEVVKQ